MTEISTWKFSWKCWEKYTTKSATSRWEKGTSSDSGSESGSHIGAAAGGGWWWRWVRVRASSSTGADVMGKP